LTNLANKGSNGCCEFGLRVKVRAELKSGYLNNLGVIGWGTHIDHELQPRVWYHISPARRVSLQVAILACQS
jgi:hypothetical protein